MDYIELNRNVVNEPNRGQNYSPFYYTTYIEVKFTDIEEPVTFSFFEESEEEIVNKITNYTV